MRSSLHSRDDRGVVAIEFVLVLPFLLVLLVIIISFAGLFQTKSRVVGAARDGARALAIKPGVASPIADTNATDGITVVLEGAACPALTNPAYQTANPPKVTAKASTTYTVDIPLVHTWSNIGVVERVSMPCG